MQQTKRRSKKGVILLALALALFVLAIVPASALAVVTYTGTVTINGPEFTTSPNITVAADVTLTNVPVRKVTKYQWRIWDDTLSMYRGPWSAAVSVTPPVTHWVNLSIPVTLPSDLHRYAVDIMVTDDSAPAETVVILQSDYVTLIGTMPPVSTVAFSPAGQLGRSNVNWTNGGAPWALLPRLNEPPFYSAGTIYADFDQAAPWQPMGTTFYRVTFNGVPWDASDIPWAPWGSPLGLPVERLEVTSWPAAPTPIYAYDGIYDVEHWAVSVAGIRQVGESFDSIGYDTKAPNVVFNFGAAVWNTGSIPFTAQITDSGGSGVAGGLHPGLVPDAEIQWKPYGLGAWQPYDPSIWAGVPPVNPLQLDPVVTVDAFDTFKYHVTGTIRPVVNFKAEYRVVVFGEDIARNWFFAEGIPGVDNMPPSTIISSVVPAGADQYMKWTNKPVTVTLLASDTGGNGVASGVNYTEYIIGDSGTYPTFYPASTAKGIQGTTVLINKTAPVGPVYLWYRSVDVAGNLEAWNRAWIWFDGKAPVLTSDSTGLWYTSHQLLGGFTVTLSAGTPNSELAPPGIEYQVPGWPSPAVHPLIGPLPWGMLPTTWTPLSQNPGTVFIPINTYPNSSTDGIWALNYRATDMAGNSSVDTTLTVKIDTRPPATLGTAGFGPADWVNGTLPFTLTATDQAPGAGVKVTIYRVDLATPWLSSVATAPVTAFDTAVPLTLLGGKPAVTGDLHTIDFFSIDNATTEPWLNWPKSDLANRPPYPGNVEQGVAIGSWIGHPYLPASVSGYKTRTVKMDVTAPVVTAMDPKNGDWQKGPGVVNFSGTDIGSGYSHTEWSTDAGTTWTSGEDAEVGGNGVITVTYRGVDNVGLKSANATIVVKIASTPPTVTAQSAKAKSGKNPTITFNITAVTPSATAVIQIRTLGGRTISTHHYANVATGSDQSRRFTVTPPLPPGKYNIRVGAVDMAGNVQTKRGSSTLIVTK